MRDIKFRCWNAFSSHMHEWSEMVEKNKIHLLGNENKSYVCEQYTGLKDKNGVEIYEGDVLLLKGKEEYNKPVVFFNGAFGVKGVTGNICALSSLVSFNRKFEVIGNIHQNPELLGN